MNHATFLSLHKIKQGTLSGSETVLVKEKS